MQRLPGYETDALTDLFIAHLEKQAAQGGPAPVLIRIETKAGHGAGKPTAKVIDEAADRYAFLIKVLGESDAETAV